MSWIHALMDNRCNSPLASVSAATCMSRRAGSSRPHANQQHSVSRPQAPALKMGWTLVCTCHRAICVRWAVRGRRAGFSLPLFHRRVLYFLCLQFHVSLLCPYDVHMSHSTAQQAFDGTVPRLTSSFWQAARSRMRRVSSRPSGAAPLQLSTNIRSKNCASEEKHNVSDLKLAV